MNLQAEDGRLRSSAPEWALVTGGSRNIGAAIALRLRADGFKVMVSSRTPPEHTDYDEFVAADFTMPEVAASAIRDAVADRPFTRFVHNAALAIIAPGDHIPIKAVEDSLAVNTVSLVALAQVLLPCMRRAGVGRIVAIGSRAAAGKMGRLAYAASKSALSGIVRTWALELGCDGITVNAVSPGPVQTELFEAHNPPGSAARASLLDGVPVGFIGEPEDIANAVSFFVADQSRFITGQMLLVCGGTSVAFIEERGRTIKHRFSERYPEQAMTGSDR